MDFSDTVLGTTFITPNFAWAEFDCHNGDPLPDDVQPNIRRLCSEVLEPIRAEFAAPIVIVSGWRSQAWNFKVGGALNSQHLEGMAADIRPVALVKLGRLRGVIENMIAGGRLAALGGVGWYPHKWIHLDIRHRPPSGHIARWDGRGIGSEVA